jgi:hypothetical protein
MLSKKHACAKSKTKTSVFAAFSLEAAACRIVGPAGGRTSAGSHLVNAEQGPIIPRTGGEAC